MRCGYDLRGRDSDVCPECGTPTSVPIAIHSAQQFHLARAALERDGLLVRFTNPGGSLGTIGVLYGGDHASPGYLWVDEREAARVESCLSEAGVAWELGALPIVDRAEPQCPTCEHALDPDGAEHCPSCGAAFQWVEIEMSEASTDEQVCRCGYELRGLTAEGRCPECGRDIAAQLGPSEPRESDEPVPLPDGESGLRTLPALVVVMVSAIGIGVLRVVLDAEDSVHLGAALLCSLVIAVGLVSSAIIHNSRRR